MDTHKLECDIMSLRRLYLLLESNSNEVCLLIFSKLLDENSRLLFKRLLDSAAKELQARHTQILATQAKISVSEVEVDTISSVSVATNPMVERLDNQLSSLHLFSSMSRKVDSDVRSCSDFSIGEDKEIPPWISRNAEDPTFPSLGRFPPFDPFRFVHGECSRSRLPLPPGGGRTSDSSSSSGMALVKYSELASIPVPQLNQVVNSRELALIESVKPKMLAQEYETESESPNSEEDLVSYNDQESEESEEFEESSRSTYSSSWGTSDGRGSYSSVSTDQSQSYDDDDDDGDEVSVSPRRGKSIERKKKGKGRFIRLKDKIGRVLHHHHHYHVSSPSPSVATCKDIEKNVERTTNKGLLTTTKKLKCGVSENLNKDIPRQVDKLKKLMPTMPNHEDMKKLKVKVSSHEDMKKLKKKVARDMIKKLKEKVPSHEYMIKKLKEKAPSHEDMKKLKEKVPSHEEVKKLKEKVPSHEDMKKLKEKVPSHEEVKKLEPLNMKRKPKKKIQLRCRLPK
ncbi:unnamed protein product [Cochlearia groenlandica]